MNKELHGGVKHLILKAQARHLQTRTPEHPAGRTEAAVTDEEFRGGDRGMHARSASAPSTRDASHADARVPERYMSFLKNIWQTCEI